MVRVPTNLAPTQAGKMLLKEFLTPTGLTQRDVAEGIGVPCLRVNELVNGSRGITPSTALRLGKSLETTPGLWMNLQRRF
jgi:addiction module HigA family antidote